MTFDFAKLPRAAQRAAFANMSDQDRAENAAPSSAGRTNSLGSGARHQQLVERRARSEERIEKLRSAFAQGRTSGRDLGGRSADWVEEVTLSDGQHAVLKQQTPRDTRTEYLGGRVANALGITDVHTAQVGPKRTVTTFVEGDTGLALVKKATQDIYSDRAKRDAAEDEVRRQTRLENGREIALLDWLIENNDRNVLNWIVSPDGKKVTPIDHGSADFRHSQFRDRETGEVREVVPKSPFVDEWVRPKMTGYRQLVSIDPQWTAEELSETRAALGSVASEFRGDEEQDWYRSMLRRLAMLEDAL